MNSLMSKGFSILVCTYNPGRRLQKLLESLSLLEVSDFSVEIVLVSNNSSDNTISNARTIWDNLKSDIPLHIYDEPKPGKLYAQLLGMEKVSYEYVVICDDDNFLFKDYLVVAYDIFTSNRDISMVGGHGIALADQEVPEWFDKYSIFYAADKQMPESGYADFLFGAGMIYRKSSWEFIHSKNFKALLRDRTGKKLLSGGDMELCHAFKIAGYKLWYDGRLKFLHYMPANRLNWEYFLKMSVCMGEARCVRIAYAYIIEGKEFNLSDWHRKFFIYLKRMVKLMPYLFGERVGNPKKVELYLTMGMLKQFLRGRKVYYENYKKVLLFSKSVSSVSK